MIHLTFNEVAQTSHVGLGAAAVLLAVAKGWPHGQLIASGAMVIFALVKELWFDVHYEDIETQGNRWVDLSFWLIGIGLANIAIWL